MSRRFSWVGFVVGLVGGLAIGLFYTWMVNPVVEYNTAPWQLNEDASDAYMALVGLVYGYEENLARAEERLAPFNFERPGLAAARQACEFFRRAESLEQTAGLVALAHAYGEITCADEVLGATLTPAGPVTIVVPTETPTPSLTPSITPTATLTPTVDLTNMTPTIKPSPTPAGPFEVVGITSFCNPRFSGALEVNVQESGGSGIPGVEVLVTWEDGEDRFFTGLQPGENAGFANYTMEADRTYRVELPGKSNLSQEMLARPCTPRGGLADGEVVITGYTVKFQRVGE